MQWLCVGIFAGRTLGEKQCILERALSISMYGVVYTGGVYSVGECTLGVQIF